MQNPTEIIKPDTFTVEHIPLDWALAYASIAPHITAAYAYLKCDNPAQAANELMTAQEKINQINNPLFQARVNNNV
ncbi:MAG: hypothetical protein AAGA83_00235 [Cyanobacteria bacterium P01_F01_bin.116]